MSNKRPETRKRLLETVIALLLDPNGSALRMVDVAKAAGVTRQTVYDHFKNRSEMLISAVLDFGDAQNVDDHLAQSRAAPTGIARMEAYTDGLMGFYPSISPVHKALTRLGAGDQDAVDAWGNRMSAMKEGCHAAMAALERDGMLTERLTLEKATDYYFTLLSIDAWSHCVTDCGWTQDAYVKNLQAVTRAVLVRPS
jgi:AcrR family transcriptional regulator